LIAACRDFELAWEGEEYSIFTSALLKALEEENAGSDGTVRCGSLFDFIATELKISRHYQGLQAFEKEQARFFFGRDKVIQQLIQKLAQANSRT